MVEGTLKMMDPQLIQHFNHFKNLLQDLLVVVEFFNFISESKNSSRI